MVQDSFNPRTREACDAFSFSTLSMLFAFQSTHAGSVRRGSTSPRPAECPFQSTHAGSVRRRPYLESVPHLRVSIHARGKRATNDGGQARIVWKGFNPRTREACDASTHSFSNRSISFNPRTREACDAKLSGRRVRDAGFQSTHAGSVRRFAVYAIPAEYSRFNPRTREACDNRLILLDVERRIVSIHARGKRATRQNVT